MDDDFFGSSAAPAAGGGGDFDFDAAAAAFPDISLDGDLPAPTGPVATPGAGAALADFGAPLAPAAPDVRITGGDEIDAFEEQFPDIGGAAVRARSLHTAPQER
jgi:hypothetical protein